MALRESRVTIHMAASLDGFIARKDGRVDWLETTDEFVGGDALDPGFVEAFLKTIDWGLKPEGWGGRTAINPHLSSRAAICRDSGIPSSSTQAISRGS
jgi:hypothetical protein